MLRGTGLDDTQVTQTVKVQPLDTREQGRSHQISVAQRGEALCRAEGPVGKAGFKLQATILHRCREQHVALGCCVLPSKAKCCCEGALSQSHSTAPGGETDGSLQAREDFPSGGVGLQSPRVLLRQTLVPQRANLTLLSWCQLNNACPEIWFHFSGHGWECARDHQSMQQQDGSQTPQQNRLCSEQR